MSEKKTKLVRIHLAALTRVEYTELIEVPNDVTDDELNKLVSERYAEVDGGQYTSDNEYWERSTSCRAEIEADKDDNTADRTMARNEFGELVEAIDIQKRELQVA